jgi:hypothetical protein
MGDDVSFTGKDDEDEGEGEPTSTEQPPPPQMPQQQQQENADDLKEDDEECPDGEEPKTIQVPKGAGGGTELFPDAPDKISSTE